MGCTIVGDPHASFDPLFDGLGESFEGVGEPPKSFSTTPSIANLFSDSVLSLDGERAIDDATLSPFT
jgi:hypothetical protein